MRNNNAFVHGLSNRKHPQNQLYRSWQEMKRRVSNPKLHNANSYFGKHISMEPSWLDFVSFYTDMKDNWLPDAHIHRVDVDNGYYKDNVVWINKHDHAILHNRLNAEKRKLLKGDTNVKATKNN